jgi:hypothetical protein
MQQSSSGRYGPNLSWDIDENCLQMACVTLVVMPTISRPLNKMALPYVSIKLHRCKAHAEVLENLFCERDTKGRIFASELEMSALPLS